MHPPGIACAPKPMSPPSPQHLKSHAPPGTTQWLQPQPICPFPLQLQAPLSIRGPAACCPVCLLLLLLWLLDPGLYHQVEAAKQHVDCRPLTRLACPAPLHQQEIIGWRVGRRWGPRVPQHNLGAGAAGAVMTASARATDAPESTHNMSGQSPGSTHLSINLAVQHPCKGNLRNGTHTPTPAHTQRVSQGGVLTRGLRVWARPVCQLHTPGSSYHTLMHSNVVTPGA
jgi:hypothetical protein